MDELRKSFSFYEIKSKTLFKENPIALRFVKEMLTEFVKISDKIEEAQTEKTQKLVDRCSFLGLPIYSL